LKWKSGLNLQQPLLSPGANLAQLEDYSTKKQSLNRPRGTAKIRSTIPLALYFSFVALILLANFGASSGHKTGRSLTLARFWSYWLIFRQDCQQCQY
jgi:hypothetical protein